MLPDQGTLPALAGGYDLLDLPDGGSIEFTPVRVQVGTIDIKVTGAKETKRVTAMRVWVSPGDKGHVPSYWDITSQLLVSDFIGALTPERMGRVRVKATKRGTGVQGRFSVIYTPL